MTAHLDVETLSTYLDQELDREGRRRVEDHLDLCSRCQDRLSGLRRIIGELQTLERLSPPSHLGVHVHRLAAQQASRQSLMQRLEQQMSRFAYPSNILPLFAVVMALIVIIYMLSVGVHRQATGRIQVHLEPPAIGLEGTRSVEAREAGGRLFRLQGDVWIEEGLEAATVAEVVEGSDPRVAAWLSADPGLQDVATLGPRVRFLTVDGVIEVLFNTP